MTSRTWDELLAMIRHGSAVADADPLEAADEAGALIASAVRDLITVVQGADSAAGLRATAALLEAVTQIVSTLEAATSPDCARRAKALGLVDIMLAEVQRLAVTAARATTDADMVVRLAAARVVRRLTTAPAIARTSRRAGARHPDEKIRAILASDR